MTLYEAVFGLDEGSRGLRRLQRRAELLDKSHRQLLRVPGITDAPSDKRFMQRLRSAADAAEIAATAKEDASRERFKRLPQEKQTALMRRVPTSTRALDKRIRDWYGQWLGWPDLTHAAKIAKRTRVSLDP